MLSYKIIESHQGRISIMSEVGIGTSVTIYLPMFQSEQVTSCVAMLPITGAL